MLEFDKGVTLIFQKVNVVVPCVVIDKSQDIFVSSVRRGIYRAYKITVYKFEYTSSSMERRGSRRLTQFSKSTRVTRRKLFLRQIGIFANFEEWADGVGMGMT